MLRSFHGFALVTLGIAAACASISSGDPAVTVTARAETAPVGTVNEDAADDPAIWRNAADPAKSLIVGTDKKGGLY
ncbi:MAG: phytase, partial [Pseudomonadota bacterium]